jgi:hypothetical protein
MKFIFRRSLADNVMRLRTAVTGVVQDHGIRFGRP